MQFRDLRLINNIFILGFALLATLYFGASFFIPFTFAAFLAALMAPVSSKLEETGLGNMASALISTVIVFLVVGGLTYLMYYQLKIFTNDLPEIREELDQFLKQLQQYASSVTGISPEEQKQMFKERSDGIMEALEQQLTLLLGNILSTAVNFLLVLIYVFLFLANRKKYVAFVLKYTSDEKEPKAREVLQNSAMVIHHYLWGRLQVMTILAIMYIISFIIFDVRYAVLLTVVGAIVTIIPYIGPFISALLPLLFVIVFGDSFTQILIFGLVVLVIQLIESYVLEPVIIGKEVQLSPLTIIIAIIVGGMIWDIAGMILFVPLFAIVKIIADNSRNLRPIGFLIANDQDESAEGWGEKIKKMFSGSKD